MKSRVAILILVLMCAGLGFILISNHNKMRRERELSAIRMQNFSNVVASTQAQLDEQRTVNTTLETNLGSHKLELKTIAQDLKAVSENLSKVQAEAKAAAEIAAAEMAKRDARLSELQGENETMTKKMTDLNSALSGLEKQIGETEQKLAASEGDREFLTKELRRLQTEKAQLEKQFNDLAVLRDQVRKLRDELSISRRLEWMRQGLYGRQVEKGGERLVRGFSALPPTNAAAPLQIEIRQDGEVRVLSSPTANAAAASTNTPAAVVPK